MERLERKREAERVVAALDRATGSGSIVLEGKPSAADWLSSSGHVPCVPSLSHRETGTERHGTAAAAAALTAT